MSVQATSKGSGGKRKGSTGAEQSKGNSNGGSADAAAVQLPTRKSGSGAENVTAKSGSARIEQHVPRPVRRVALPVQAHAPRQKEAPLLLLGVLLAAVIAVMITAWWLMSQGHGQVARSGSADADAQLEAQAVVAPIGADGRQTLDFVVNGYTASYEPKAIKVKKGIPVHFDVKLNGPDPG
jgi:hypothetical protein